MFSVRERDAKTKILPAPINPTQKLSEELSDTSLVIITDASGTGGNWNQKLSLGKMIRLAGMFHMPVYEISTESDDEKI